MKPSAAVLVVIFGLALSPVTTAQQTSSELLFPFYSGSEANFTGFAVTNFATAAAQLTLEGYGDDGVLLAFPRNPASETLAANGQLARLGAEFFGVSPTATQAGWIRVTTDTPELASFFQFGNGMTGVQTMLDGGIAFTAPAQTLFFTRIYEGDATFPSFGLTGPQDASTVLSIANPNNQAVTLTLTIPNAFGQPVAPSVQIELPALGRLFDTVSTIFGQAVQTSDAYVKVETDGPGIVGFQLIILQDSVLGLNAVTASSPTFLYSAQLANGGDAAGRIFTSVNLVNTSAAPTSVVIRATDDQGQEIAVSPVTTVLAFGVFRRSVDQIFASISNPTSDNLVTGSMIVEVLGGSGVVGDVIFGDPGGTDTGTPERIDYAAALPLQGTRFTRAIFSQVANGKLAADDASLDLFTGLALLNANESTAGITVRVFDSAGTLIGDAAITLGANQRLDTTVEALVPESADLIGGFIEVVSDEPLVAQQLFGNGTLDYMSAVPPTIIE